VHIEEEIENRAENLYISLVEIENLNYYRDKLENDIKSIESNMNFKKQGRKEPFFGHI